MEHHKKNKPGFLSIFSIFTKAFELNCPDCGSKINEDDSICPGCGTDLEAPLGKTELRSISQSYLEEARKILNKGGDFHKGLEYCDQVLEYDPDCAEAYNLKGLFLDGLDSLEEAIESYRKALEIRPAYFDALNNLREAEAEYVRKYSRSPDTSPGKISESDPDDPTEENEPNALTEPYLEEARRILEQGHNYRKGLDFCDQALEHDPECAEAYNLIGLFLDRLNYAEEAIDAYRKAVEIKPSYRIALKNLRDAEEEYRRRYENLP